MPYRRYRRKRYKKSSDISGSLLLLGLLFVAYVYGNASDPQMQSLVVAVAVFIVLFLAERGGLESC